MVSAPAVHLFKLKYGVSRTALQID